MKEEYVLQEGFTYTGEKIRTIRIIPDFGIYHNGNLVAIADPKGMIMPDFKLKIKLLKAYFINVLKREVPIFMPTNKKEMAEVINEILKLIK
jgi:hypothetical protein